MVSLLGAVAGGALLYSYVKKNKAGRLVDVLPQ